ESQKTTVEGATRLSRQHQEDQAKLDQEVKRSTAQQTKVHTENEQAVAAQRQDGEKKVSEQKMMTESQLKHQEDQYKYTTEQKKKQFESQDKEMHENYQKDFERNKDVYGKNLKRQNDQFQETFRRNEAAQRESVSAQKEMFAKELALAKKQFFISNNSIQEHKDDPFYKIQDR